MSRRPQFPLPYLLAASLVKVASSDPCSLSTFRVPVGECVIPVTDGIIEGSVYSWGLLLVVHGTQLCCTPSLFTSTPVFDSREVCSDAHRGEGTLAQCRSQHGNWLNDSDGKLFQPFNQLKGQNENIDRFNINVEKEMKATIDCEPGKS